MDNKPLLPKPFYFDDSIWGADTWPLISAAYTGDLETVTNIVEKDSHSVRAQFAYYEPLHYAVKGGSIDVVKILIAHGAHPKAPGWYSLGDETPIAKAIDRGFSEIAELLKSAAAAMPPYTWPEVKTKNQEEQLLYDFEIACGYTPDLTIVESVLAKHPEWATRGLYEAIHHNRMDIIQLLITAEGNLNGAMPFACWFTPLMHSLRYKEPRWALAEFLLDKGVSVNGTNGLGMSALHIVIFQGLPEAANWLLDRGADINFTEPEFNSTPLGWAARWERAEMAKLLLDRGANVSLPEDWLWAQPTSWAKQKGHKDIFQMINDWKD
jgi:ankyrin repeat protein